jgi:hypothetical protein
MGGIFVQKGLQNLRGIIIVLCLTHLAGQEERGIARGCGAGVLGDNLVKVVLGRGDGEGCLGGGNGAALVVAVPAIPAGAEDHDHDRQHDRVAVLIPEEDRIEPRGDDLLLFIRGFRLAGVGRGGHNWIQGKKGWGGGKLPEPRQEDNIF